MQYQANTIILTQRAVKYAKMLVNHWGRHGSVHGNGYGTVMTFARWEGLQGAQEVTVDASDDTLFVSIRTEVSADLSPVCTSVAEHLQRFASSGNTETLDIRWSSDPQ